MTEAWIPSTSPPTTNFGTGMEEIDRHPYVVAATLAVPGPDACGQPADTHEIFQDIEAETIKRGTLQQGQIRWAFVETEAGRLLTHSKDFRLLVSLMQSLGHGNTSQRFALGLQVTATFLSRWTRDAHPRSRLKPRLAARLVEALEQLTPKNGSDFEQAGVLSGCNAAARVCADSLAEIAPEIGIVLAALPAKLEMLSIPTNSLLEQPPVLPGGGASRSTPSAGETLLDQTAPRPETLRLEVDNERALRQSLSVVADFMMRLDVANPLPYRVRRYATWFGIIAPPPIRTGQRTVLTPVSEEVIERYRVAVDRGQADLDMVQRLERSCHLQPFWLEGQYLASQLAQVADRPGVADAIREEASRFFANLSAIRGLCFADGSPMVPDDVAHWLTAPALAQRSLRPADSSGEMPDAAGSLDGDMQAVARNARALVKQGEVAAALTALDNAKTSARSPRSRTLWEVMLIEMLNELGLRGQAQTQAQRLREAVTNLPVPEWEPELFRRLARLENRKGT